MAVTSQIVTVNAQVTPTPAPSVLQQSGALVSTTGTDLSAGSYSYFGTLGALEAALSVTGNYLELQNMATTHFAQGDVVGFWVLELGVGSSAADEIAALATWIAANPNVFYAYLTPATWDAAGSTLNTMAANYSSPTGKTYFFQSTSSGTMSAYAPTTKAIVGVVPSPTAGATEFQAATLFYQWLSNSPSSAAPSAPMGFRFVFGVTPWAILANQTAINSILTGSANLIISGSEGGISTAMIERGTTMDGNQMMGWYAVDYVLIQAKLQLAAAIIQGSNENPPLYYNQFGINQLLEVAKKIGTAAISFGLLQSADFTATPFADYIALHPSDYSDGIYNGLSCTCTPQRGFQQITFNLDAVQF